MSEQASVEKSGATPKELEDVVRGLGLIVSNTFLYGPAHGVTRKAQDDCHVQLTRLFERIDEVAIDIAETGITANGTLIELKNPLLKMFAQRLADLSVTSFALTKGMSLEKFTRFVQIINTKPDELKKSGGFSAAISAAALDTVKTRMVTIRAVTEDELVVNKSVVGDPVETMASIQDMVSLLSGGKPAGGDQSKPEKGLQRMAESDPSKLGEVILQATEVEQNKAGKPRSQQEVTELVVGCLRKVYDVLSKNPILKTQKGKKSLSKTLSAMEEQIMARLEAKAPPGTDLTAQRKLVADAIEEMHDEVEIEGLATDYMKRRAAMEMNEKKILRFIKSKGLDRLDESELRLKLEESGLTPEQWQDLLSRSGSGKKEETIRTSGEDESTEKHLALLLSRLGDSFAPVGDVGVNSDAQAIPGVRGIQAITAVDDEIRDLVQRTEQKIEDLVKVIRDESSEVGADDSLPPEERERRRTLSRRKMLGLLAEIGQEFCQPLSVVNCSIDMIRSKQLGDVTPAQMDILGLASTSGERLRVLADKLLEISGLPDTMVPDAEIQASLYEPKN